MDLKGIFLQGIKHELMDDEIATTHNVDPSEVVTTVSIIFIRQ